MKKVFFLLFLFFISLSVSADDAVIATGTGATAEEAKKSAFINAVEQRIGVMVSSDILVENGELIKDRIHANTQGYIDSYTILSTVKDGELFVVTIKALVSEKRIKSDIEEISHLNDAKASYEETDCVNYAHFSYIMCNGGMISISNMNYGIRPDSYMKIRYYMGKSGEYLQIYVVIGVTGSNNFHSAKDQFGGSLKVVRLIDGSYVLQTEDISYLKKFAATGLSIEFARDGGKSVGLNIPSAYIEGYVKYLEDLFASAEKTMMEKRGLEESLFGKKPPFSLAAIYKRYVEFSSEGAKGIDEVFGWEEH
jgi:hypothetical protein